MGVWKRRRRKKTTDANKFNEWVNKKETDKNNELFKRHFQIQKLSDMFKLLYETIDKEKNSKLVRKN